MSSRLFQEIREKRGLAYAVYSFASNFADAGMVGVYAGLPAGQGRRGARRSVATSSARSPRTASPTTSCSAARASCGARSCSAWRTRARGWDGSAKAELVYGELLGVDEILARIDAVTLDDIRLVARELLEAAPTLAVVGPFDDPDRFAPAIR